VLGLTALTSRLAGHHRVATGLFADLLKEAGKRIDKDAGSSVTSGEVVAIGRADFEARYFQGFARCGLVLAGRADVASAIASFRMSDVASPPHAPGLIERMVFMLACLDTVAPGTFKPVIGALGMDEA
jgi:hypothetical protein